MWLLIILLWRSNAIHSQAITMYSEQACNDARIVIEKQHADTRGQRGGSPHLELFCVEDGRYDR